MVNNERSKMPVPDRRQQLLVFFSADLANSTAFKNRHQAQNVGHQLIPPRWPAYFSRVFNRILELFADELAARRDLLPSTVILKPRLWKINGDELLFRETVVAGDEGLKWLVNAVTAFAAVIARIDAEILPDGGGLRGCVWTAGFPIRNKEIRFPVSQSVPIIRIPDQPDLPDFDTGQHFRDGEGLVDYLGPDMDLGFRIAQTASPGRLVCSLDVAYFLLQRREAPDIHHVGWRELKGIAGGAPYPVLWVNIGDKKTRHPWEGQKPSAELSQFLASQPLDRKEFQILSETMWAQLPDYFQKPYTSLDDMAPRHTRIWLGAGSDTELGPIILHRDPF